MAKIKVRTRTSDIIEYDGREFEVAFSPEEHHDILVETLDNGKTVIGYLSQDPEPPNPRDYDNVGVMVCWHKRYKLGDTHSYDHPDALWRDLLGDAAEQLETKKEAEYSQWWDEHPSESFGGKPLSEFLAKQNKRFSHLRRELIEASGIIVLPLYLYDHSGITISTGSFSCPWDSGQVGYIYTTPELLDKMGVKPEDAIKAMKSEVEEYDKYLTGDAHGVCLEVFDHEGKKIEEDAVWGHLGGDYAQGDLEGQFKYETEKHSKSEATGA